MFWSPTRQNDLLNHNFRRCSLSLRCIYLEGHLITLQPAHSQVRNARRSPLDFNQHVDKQLMFAVVTKARHETSVSDRLSHSHVYRRTLILRPFNYVISLFLFTPPPPALKMLWSFGFILQTHSHTFKFTRILNYAPQFDSKEILLALRDLCGT